MLNRHYTVIKAPFGALYLTAENDRIVRITPERPPALAAVRHDDTALLSQASDALSRYFCGQRRVPFTIPDGRFSPFQHEVYDAIRHIPYGQIISSTHLASQLGKPYAVRAIEALCRDNPYWIAIPCHRVLLYNESTSCRHRLLTATESLRRLEKRFCQKPPTS